MLAPRRIAYTLETRIIQIGGELSLAFARVLDAIPGGPHRPQWLARVLGVNVVLTSRILKAAQQHDPMAVAHMMPGPEPLRRLLRAAEKKKVDAALISEARAAVDRFEQLIAVEAGDRSALDAIISGWLPDARQKVELLAKQAVFRGVSQLLGTACDVEHCTTILYPSETSPDRADELCAFVTRGLRRLRPGLVVSYDTIHTAGPMLTVSGEPVEGLTGVLLEDFCSQPLPQLKVTQLADRMQYTLSGEDVGARSAVNLAHATLLRARKELSRGPEEPARKAILAIGVAVPAKTLVFDVLLHESIFPAQTPALYLHRGTIGDGPPDAADPGRALTRLDVLESLQPLGQGISTFRCADTPAYQDIIRYLCQQRHWDGNQLRGFRCRIEYPMYSSQVVMGFDVPAHTGAR